MVKYAFVLAAALGVAVGCASVPLQPADRAALAAARVYPIVPVTGDLDLRDSRLDLVSLWAAAYASYEGQKRAAETGLTLEQAKIDLGEMAREEFEQALSRGGVVLSAESDPAVAVFQLEVKQIGLKPAGPYSSSVQPLVDVRAHLFDANGRRLWSGRGLVLAAFWEDTPAHEYDELIANPELLRETFRVAFRQASEELVEALLEP